MSSCLSMSNECSHAFDQSMVGKKLVLTYLFLLLDLLYTLAAALILFILSGLCLRNRNGVDGGEAIEDDVEVVLHMGSISSKSIGGGRGLLLFRCMDSNIELTIPRFKVFFFGILILGLCRRPLTGDNLYCLGSGDSCGRALH